MSNERGLYEKFRIQRTDGKSAPGEKHDGCEYFVLDLTHDPLAIPALQAYSLAARQAGHDKLANDLTIQVGVMRLALAALEAAAAGGEV